MSRHLYEKHRITRTQHGNTQVPFNSLVTKYQPKIESLIYGQVQNRLTAEDLTQETWIKAFRAIHTFRGDSAFYSWLYQIAQNVCTDFFLRKQARAKTFRTLEVDDTLAMTDTHPSPLELLEKKELCLILRLAIRQLKGEMRKKVFYLRYTEELPIKAIAARIQRSEGTVKTHLHKAHYQLRELLRPYLQLASPTLKWRNVTLVRTIATHDNGAGKADNKN